MPKVTRKDAAEPLQEVGPSGMDTEATQLPTSGGAPGEKPVFPPLSAYELNGKVVQFRRVPVPQHRMTPLKTSWLALYKPVTENLKLDMRMNLKSKKVMEAWVYCSPRIRCAALSSRQAAVRPCVCLELDVLTLSQRRWS